MGIEFDIDSQCLWSLQTLELPEVYNRFDDLAILAIYKLDSLLVCDIIRFSLSVYERAEAIFLQASMAPEYWEALE